MLYDFHTHTTLSDGGLTPCELIRRAKMAGYTAIALTDHVGRGALARVITELKEDRDLIAAHWEIQVVIGVELTHVPAAALAGLAGEARRLGAEIVVVHGESPVEPVEPGTNLAAASCPWVDILAHPGFLTPEVADRAAKNGVFLEISARGGHNRANGAVVSAGRQAGARFLVNSDAHGPGDLLDPETARKVAAGSGLRDEECAEALLESPRTLLARLRSSMV